MPRKGSKRVKHRTHIKNEDALKGPLSYVFKQGKIGKSPSQLILDFRAVFRPFTQQKIKQKRNTKLKHFLNASKEFSQITYLTKNGENLNLKIIKLPKGPTFLFRVKEFTLVKDIAKITKKFNNNNNLYFFHPLVLFKNFDGVDDEKQLLNALFKNSFAKVDKNTKINQIRRVVIFEYDNKTKEIKFRHYSIRKNNFEDEKSLKLTEIGPRLTLSTIKIEESVNNGRVLYKFNDQNRIKEDFK
ncbi:hypothetical protein MHBO_000690 [Bonamia ostreae]|uniref:Brix domain-containing protein n=1 Tax=Bonamia ostreae TaxID=126728 RepID=A0ABV2AGI8_9EUKA